MPWLNTKSADFFSNAFHAFRNLFWKNAIWANFNHMFEVFQTLFFAFIL